MDNDTLIKVEDLCKIYNPGENEVRALDHVSLEIKKGELVAIIGQSGSGKSTFMNMLGCLDVPTSGRYYLNGTDVSEMTDNELSEVRNREIGFIFQGFNLIANLNAIENVELPLIYRGVDKKTRHQLAVDSLKLVGLEKRMDHKPSEMSGGQQQRVAIARALVKMPRVLLLDEPLSNLDARLRLQTREEIRRIQKETGITTVFVTHDQEEAMSISDRIVVMKEGVIQQTGRPQEVYENPVNLFVARFLGTPQINLFEGRVEKGQLLIGEEAVLSVRGVEDQPLTVGIRPEGFLLREDGPLSLDLVRVEVMGRDISVVSTSAVSINPTVRSIIDAEMRLQVKEKKVCFALRPSKVLLFHKETEERIYPEEAE